MPRGPLRMLRRAVARRRDGSFVLRLADDEVELLTSLADQLDPMLEDPSADTALRRLFPPAHTEDVLAEAAWQIEQGSSLRDSRRAALAALRHPAGEPMTEDALVTWMQGVNSLRLVLAERLGVSADPSQEQDLVTALRDLAASDEAAEADRARQLLGAWQVYGLLGWMVDGAVSALGDPTA